VAVGARTKGWLFVLPWIIGLSAFTLYPFVASIYYSFTHFSVLQSPKFIGASNYIELAQDEVFWLVLKNTLLYAALSIPAGVVVSLGMALMMNSIRRGQVFYSVVFYIPHLVPAVASTIIWMWIFNGGLLSDLVSPVYDFLNMIRRAEPGDYWRPPAWLGSQTWALPSLVLMGLWSIGQTAFIYLAKLQDVPQELYEAAEIDGANTWHKIRHITLPMISPIILFNVIMSIIGTLQVFTEPYLMTGGGPARSTMFLPQYIWDNAFVTMRMGYACAMSWILFVIILGLTLLAFRLSRDWVYYAGR
jgi:multiple sugar transport system permease protein